MAKKFIRIEEITLSLDDDETLLKKKISSIIGLSRQEIKGFSIVKKAIDSRDKKKILFVYSVNVDINDPVKYLAGIKKLSGRTQTEMKRHKVRVVEGYAYYVPKIGESPNKPQTRPVIVGTGPAGLFAGLVLAMSGLNPLIIERGQDVDTRSKDVDMFTSTGKLNPNSNVQFGEGGAGTFSDGKLYTLVNDPRSKFVFEEFVEAGAPAEILYDAKPHIGTDNLKVVIKKLREKIISLGGEVRFNSCLTGVNIQDNKLTGVEINGSEKVATDDLILAIGHSARDTYEMLYNNKIEFRQKPFAMGLRIEHSAEMINRSQFSDACINPKLPTASYRLVNHNKETRSVFSFCMCPGGYLVAASSEDGRLTVNGMSEYNQDSPMSNSALLVGILPSDFESDHPLAGIAFQRKREEQAFIAGGSNYNAPAQLVGDFLKKQKSTKLGSLSSTYKPGITLTSLDDCLPSYVIDAIRKAIPEFDQKIHGFASNDALLVGIEARSSSVVTMVRDESLQSNIRGVYPTGEGAGYAGGITSAAIDGLKVAENIVKKYT